MSDIKNFNDINNPQDAYEDVELNKEILFKDKHEHTNKFLLVYLIFFIFKIFFKFYIFLTCF